MTVFFLIVAFAMGLVTSIYIPMIAQISRTLGSPFMGNVPFFAVAFATSIVIALAAGQRAEAFGRITSVPLWLLASGIMSAFIIVGVSFTIPKIGTAALFVLMVAGQILMGAVVNHYGLLNVPVQPITAVKALGIALVIGGAALVSFTGKA